MAGFDLIVEIFNIVLNLVIEYMFFASLWKNKFNHIINAISFAIISFLFLFVKVSFNGMLASYISMFILTLLIAMLFESNFSHKLIYTAILHSIMAIIEMIVAMIITTLFSVDFVAGKEGVLYISGIILSKFILFITVVFIRLKKQSVLLEHYKKNYFGVFSFPISSLIIILLQHKIFCDNPEQSVFVQYFVLFSYTILLLSNIIVFDFIDTLYTNTVNKNKLNTANELISSQSHQYQTLLENNREIMKIQHDHKNFCSGIISELMAGNIENAINALYKEHDICFNNTLTFSNAIQVIVNIKSQLASKDNIKIVLDHHNLNSIVISATDLAILIGNALDNAIEACRCVDKNDVKIIEVFVALKNNKVFIKVKNPTHKTVDVKKLETTKSTKKTEHGFGIISINQIAKKYDGDVVLNSDSNTFTLTIVLNNIK